jgi:hypothetical protein
MTALISFLGSAGLRWLLGELLGIFRAREDRRAEIDMLRLQADLERERAERQRLAVADAAAAGVKLIEAQREASAGDAADRMMLAGVEAVGRPSGVPWVDALNASVRPVMAYVALLLLAGHAVAPEHVVLAGMVGEVVGGVLGIFVGGRIMATGR